MFVSLILIPNPLCSLWVAFSIISIEIGVVGYMTLWNVNLDSISMINLIMCIGFSVDFSAHISYAYLAAKVDTPDERVQECLYTLGMPILQGGMSTILGICTLILAPSYIFVTFFKTVFLVIFFGAMHGIFLLPVLLSLLGPGSCKSNKKSKKPSQSHPLYGENINLPHGLEDLRIPRPQGLSSSHNGTPKFNGPFLTNGTVDKDKLNVEKDLGLGTSGEDSSESSLGKGVPTEKEAEGDKLPNLRSTERSLPIMEVYNNNGYISDDLEAEERRNQERRSRYGEYDYLRGHGRHSEYGGRRHTRQQQRPQYSSARTRSTPSYTSSSLGRYPPPENRDPKRNKR